MVILVQYQDVKFSLSDPHDYFTRLLNEPGFSDLEGTGSAQDYFIESSHGQFLPQFDVYGPVTLPENQAYYGSNTGGYNDAYAWKMVATAADYLDDQVDFSEYDRDNDGYVDNVYVFYAGEGESGGGGFETVWPHSSKLSTFDNTPHIHDGKIVDRYACSNEMDFETPDGVGTFIHEFSHVMGLPDFYATDYSSSFTPGSFSALDQGSYNNNSRTPPLYSAFERYCVGWLDLEIISGKDNIVIPPIGSNKAFVIETGKPDEFYILENRQKISWDTHMPGHGMLVWHIDYDKEAWGKNAVNNDPQHQRLDIVEADDMRDYDSYSGDPFPGDKHVTSFTDDTTPSMRTWDDKRLSMPITGICETDEGFITFKIAGGINDLNVPADVKASATRAHSASIEWSPVEGATDYLVTVFTPGNLFIVPGYDSKASGGKTQLEISGLQASGSYSCYVRAIGSNASSAPSAIVDFSTPEEGFSDFKVISSEATEVAPDSFTANWEALTGATDYQLTVFECSPGEPESMMVDFTDGVGAMPADWVSTSQAIYNMAAYAGKAIPSLRMTATGDNLTTGEFPDFISGISFWQRGNGSATAANSILVEGKCDGIWQSVATLPVVNAAGGNTELLDDLPANITAIRISYIGEAKGSLAIDDIIVCHGNSTVLTPLETYSALRTGNILRHSVKNLAPQSDYCYSVTGIDSDGNLSLPSDHIYVSTPTSSGVVEIHGNCDMDASVKVCDLTGRVVASGKKNEILSSLSPGIYIIYYNGKSSKIIIKHKPI